MSGNCPVVLATNRMRFLCVCVSDNITSEQDTPKHVNVGPRFKKYQNLNFALVKWSLFLLLHFIVCLSTA